MMKRTLLCLLAILTAFPAGCWGFFGHRQINYYAVFLLPPQMLLLYKPHQDFLVEHAVDPDMRRYALPAEAPRHYIDLDHYGSYPYTTLPRKWKEAMTRYTEDSLNRHGIVPWWIQTMLARLTQAFRDRDQVHILKYSAEIGHYIADAHVPLHASSNHNGQLTGQRGIHGFWESRVPELLAAEQWDFFIGKASYIRNPLEFTWQRVLESGAAADSVLKLERQLSAKFPADQKYAFEERNGKTVRQYSSAYTRAYDKLLRGMVERRMRQSIFAVASFWYTAWVNAGQPDLNQLSHREFNPEEISEFEKLQQAWSRGQTGEEGHD